MDDALVVQVLQPAEHLHQHVGEDPLGQADQLRRTTWRLKGGESLKGAVGDFGATWRRRRSPLQRTKQLCGSRLESRPSPRLTARGDRRGELWRHYDGTFDQRRRPTLNSLFSALTVL